VCDTTGTDIFFYYDDLDPDFITRDLLVLGSHKKNIPGNRVGVSELTGPIYEIEFSFLKVTYQGRHGQSIKATNIKLNYIKRISPVTN
jgi:hypothetical protein